MGGPGAGELGGGEIAVDPVGVVVGIRDHGPVLAGVEQHQTVGVIDDVDVDRQPYPAAAEEEPDQIGLAGALGVLVVDLAVSGHDHRHFGS